MLDGLCRQHARGRRYNQWKFTHDILSAEIRDRKGFFYAYKEEFISSRCFHMFPQPAFHTNCTVRHFCVLFFGGRNAIDNFQTISFVIWYLNLSFFQQLCYITILSSRLLCTSVSRGFAHYMCTNFIDLHLQYYFPKINRSTYSKAVLLLDVIQFVTLFQRAQKPFRIKVHVSQS